VHNFARECQSHWHKNFLPHVRYVATIPCESVRHKSNTFHTILALCTCLCRLHLQKPVSMKQTKHSRKSETQNLCSKCPPFTRTLHSNDYATAQSLPRWWCGPAASSPSADLLSTSSHHGSVNGRHYLEGYPRCCSPPDSNLANWMATSFSGEINSWRLSAAWWQCHVHSKRSDINITSLGKGCTWHAT